MKISEKDMIGHFKETIKAFKEEYDDMSDSRLVSVKDQLLCLRVFMRRME